MRKYILDKHDVFGKNVLIARGKLKNYDIKLWMSLLASKCILLYGKDTLPEEIYLNLSVITSAALFTEIIFDLTDIKRQKKAKEKLKKIIQELNNRGYELNGEQLPIYSSHEKGCSSLIFSDGRSINYVDGTYSYVDLNKVNENIKDDNCTLEEFMKNISGSDISECVYETLLSKRKLKKYKKSKQNK